MKLLLMADDPKKTGRRDAQRINVKQDHEVEYWSEKFGVKQAMLKQAVKAVGPVVEDIRKYLGK